MNITKYVQLLEQHLSKLFPTAKIKLYDSRRSNYVHMIIDRPLFVLDDYEKIVSEIQDFMYEQLDERFKLVFP